MSAELKLKDVKEKLFADSYSIKEGVVTLRWGFFYTMGRSTEKYIQQVKEKYPNAVIFDSGQVRKSFRGGASVANSSHFYVKFSLKEPTHE